MDPEHPIYVWPTADATTVAVAAGILLFLFFGALFSEFWRRRREVNARLNAEWHIAHQIVKERELGEAEWKLLESLVKRHMPRSPHKALTVRQAFDQIVDAELGDVERAKDEALLERQAVVLRDIRSHLGLTFIPLGQRIQSTRELYLEQALWCGKDHERSEWYRVQVVNVDEVFFHVLPGKLAGKIPFQPGDLVHFRMWREEDARYEFKARLVRIEPQPFTLVFRHTRDLARMQAREHFRLSFDKPTDVAIVSAPLDGDMSHVDRRPVVTRLRGRITNLSAGGIAVLVHQPVPMQVLLRFRLDLEDGQEPVEVTARLIEALPLSGGQYLLRGEFVAHTLETGEAITHYVFRKQKQMIPAE